jgi:hypothetical protein
LSPKPQEKVEDEFLPFKGMGRTTSMKTFKEETPKIEKKSGSITPSPQGNFSPFTGMGRTTSMKSFKEEEKKEETKPFVPFQQSKGRSLK